MPQYCVSFAKDKADENYNFFPTNFSKSLPPPKEYEIIFVTIEIMFPFDFRSIQTAIFLPKTAKYRYPPQNEVKITIILFSTEIISLLTRLNFEEKKRKRNERPRRIVTQIYSRVFFFFFFLIVVRSTVYYAVFTEWREGGERERGGGEGPVLTARLTKARPPVKLIAHKMKRLFLWRWGRPITGVGRVQRRGTGAFSAIS